MAGFRFIWIDNDACPRRIRELIFEGSKRSKVPVKVVGNRYMHPPAGFDVQVICVTGDFDAADNHIAEHVEADDIVITADIPLADRVVTKGAIALDPRGRIYDASSVKEALAMRNLRQELRSGGELMGGPSGFDTQDVKKFAGELNKLLQSRRG